MPIRGRVWHMDVLASSPGLSMSGRPGDESMDVLVMLESPLH